MAGVPEPVARVAQIMSGFRPHWSLCGGWAVDAWLGRRTRDHGDIDISVFEDDQRALFEHLAGWQLIAHDTLVAGDTTEPWDGRPLRRPAHIHASVDRDTVSSWVKNPKERSPDGFKLEIVIDERSGIDWVFNPGPRISLPMGEATRESRWGLPTAAPEVILFYKATAYHRVEGMKERPQDQVDFLALLPHLSNRESDWLREAISALHPQHPWLGDLVRSPNPAGG